jgi:CheY-like chemotaxis protein
MLEKRFGARKYFVKNFTMGMTIGASDDVRPSGFNVSGRGCRCSQPISGNRIMAENWDKQPGHDGSEPGPTPSPRLTVLLVDDDESVRRLITRYLSLSGLCVLAAESGSKAMTIWREHKNSIDLLLTDMVMPGINGLELAVQLQAERPDLCMLFTSGYDAGIAGDDGVLHEGMHFLQKPYRPEQLVAAVHAALEATPGPILSVC